MRSSNTILQLPKGHNMVLMDVMVPFSVDTSISLRDKIYSLEHKRKKHRELLSNFLPAV